MLPSLAQASWRQHTAAQLQQLATPKASAESVLLIPRDSVTDLDGENASQRGNLDELDGRMRPDRGRGADRRQTW